MLIPGFYDVVRPPGSEVRFLEALPFEDEILRLRYPPLPARPHPHGRLGYAAPRAHVHLSRHRKRSTGEGMRTILPKQAKAKVNSASCPIRDPEVLVRQLRHHST